ncbi:hypothetical protein [Planctomycetes bacterium SV_7m_r]
MSVPRGSLGDVQTMLAKELSLLSESTVGEESELTFEAVIPAILKSENWNGDQVFLLTIHQSESLPERNEGELPAIVKFSVDPNYGRSATEITHVIVMIHGIRDIGNWQHNVTHNLVAKGTAVEMLQYQLYPAMRFLWPWDGSKTPVQRVLKRMRALKNQYPNARMSVIAHSFGTYVTLKAIEADADLQFWKIVFCGSVANEQFEWSDIKRRIGDGDRATKDFVINDCGTGDVFPILGATFGWHYGMAGATGFSEGFIVNRFHKSVDGLKGGHGLYFSPEFVRQHWRPFLIEDQAPSCGDGVQGEDLPRIVKWLYHGWFRWLCRFLAWIALFIAFLAGVVLSARLVIAAWPAICDFTRQLFGLDSA